MQPQVDAILREANQYRNATAKLSADFKAHAGLKRELDATARDLQSRVDRFVRHSAEETMRLTYGLQMVENEYHGLHVELEHLRHACSQAEKLCVDAKRTRDQLRAHLASVRSETHSIADAMDQYIARTRANIDPLQHKLVELVKELRTLQEEQSFYDRRLV